MSKAILMSIQPQWVARILNGDKTIEVRKKFPKDYVGWVYIYCTKNKKETLWKRDGRTLDDICCNGKVVARFWCDKVEEITCRKICGQWESYTNTLGYSEIAKESCLHNIDIVHYLNGKNGYAIHISKLEIFDKPKELSEFSIKKLYYDIVKNSEDIYDNTYYCEWILKPIDKAPQSWQYVEVNEDDK